MRLIDADNLLAHKVSGEIGNLSGDFVPGFCIDRESTVDAVPRDEYDALLKRFRHLLESDFIRSFDECDPRSGTYKRDITEADNVVSIVCCAKCRHWIKNSTASGTFKRCALIGSNTSRGFYCANGVRKADEND